MRNLRHALGCLYLFCLLPLGTGCQALYSYQPVYIEVQDIESHKPIPGAEVHLSYPLTPPSQAPWDSSAVAGQDGIASLRVASCGDDPVLLVVHAPGYLGEQKGLMAAAVRDLKSKEWHKDISLAPIATVVELYGEPIPSIELVLPKEYRGYVRATLQIQDDMACPPGQRCFRYDVPISGDVRVMAPALLRRVASTEVNARYANAEVLPRNPKGMEVGFSWLKAEGTTHTYFVGTQYECDEIRRQSARHENGDLPRQPSSGQSHSSGRRGGRDTGNGSPPPGQAVSSIP